MHNLFILLGFWLFCCSFNAKALVIAHAQGQFYPHEYSVEGKLKGLHIDIVEQAANSLKLAVRFKSLPWKRAIKALKQGDVDGLTFIGKTPQREQFAYFESGNILSEARFWPVILRKNRHKIRFNGQLTSLKNHRIAVGTGFKYGEPFDSATYLNKVSVVAPEAKLLATLLRLNRVDVLIYDIRALRLELSNEYVDQHFYSFQRSVSENLYYIAFSKRKRSRVFSQAFAEAVFTYKASLEFRQKLKQYGVAGQNNIAIIPPES